MAISPDTRGAALHKFFLQWTFDWTNVGLDASNMVRYVTETTTHLVIPVASSVENTANLMIFERFLLVSQNSVIICKITYQRQPARQQLNNTKFFLIPTLDFYVANLCYFRLAESVLDEMLQCQVSPDVFSYSALSSTWAKKGGESQGYLVN